MTMSLKRDGYQIKSTGDGRVTIWRHGKHFATITMNAEERWERETLGSGETRTYTTVEEAVSSTMTDLQDTTRRQERARQEIAEYFDAAG